MNLFPHAQLQHFEPIGLEEMGSVKLMKRVDTKFVFPEFLLTDILKELQGEYRVFTTAGKNIHRYESLYFDDENLTFYNSHHRRKMHRFKLRFRTYVDSNVSFLEVKERWKGRTFKERIFWEEDVPDLSALENKIFLGKYPFADRKLMPILTNSFERITLVSLERQERLTLDTGIRFHDTKNQVVEPGLKGMIIAELKQGNLNRYSPFMQFMKDRHIRPYRLSKYCMGIMALREGEVKSNRFKKKHLKLQKLTEEARKGQNM